MGMHRRGLLPSDDHPGLPARRYASVRTVINEHARRNATYGATSPPGRLRNLACWSLTIGAPVHRPDVTLLGP